MIGRLATLESSRVRWPSQPASTKPAVEWMSRPEAAERGLALEAGHQVGGQRDLLLGRPEHELAGVEDEWVLPDVDQLGEVLLVLAHVDHPAGVVAEQPEVAGRRGDPPTRAGCSARRTGRSRCGRRRAPHVWSGRREPCRTDDSGAHASGRSSRAYPGAVGTLVTRRWRVLTRPRWDGPRLAPAVRAGADGRGRPATGPTTDRPQILPTLPARGEASGTRSTRVVQPGLQFGRRSRYWRVPGGGLWRTDGPGPA